MEPIQLNWIANFIWSIADDVLRDLYVRGKYRDVILPMTVLRRLDAVLEPTKKDVLDMKTSLDKAGIVHQDQALRQAARQAFYNTSKFTLRDLRARASQQQLKADFEAYLDGFSPNVPEILENFEFRNQIPRLSKADALGTVIEKFLDPSINLGPNPVLNGDGSIKIPGLDNHAMGTIFEELVRRFNEENNEEAGEHWTPRDAIKLMAKLIFLPIAEKIESGTYLLYDGALGTGGMLTVAEETSGGGRKPEPELDRLSNILKTFNDQFGNIRWSDADRVHQLITEDIPAKVSADSAYQNAKKNSDKQNARIEHDKALARVMTAVLKDDTELFKQFSDNESFRKWLTDTVFAMTYN
jgi:type I restriction-modification system DNA methylase subunit